MNIGYVGLGNMGGALARRLLQSFPLHVYDRDAAALARMAGAGATACSSLHELAAACQVVLTCLPTSAHLRSALFDAGGLAEGLAPGAMVIDQTSGDPAVTRALSRTLAERGIDLVDAPVSGGPDGAEAGTIAIMVGATPEQHARAAPVLGAISPHLFHAGGSGAGHAIKLVNNLVSGAQRVLSLEAITLAAKNGIDPRTACDILAAGGARNAYLESYFRQRLLGGKARLGFSLGLMHKDLRLACDMGSLSEVPLFMANAAKEYYQMCIGQLGADANVQAVALVADRLAGTQVVPPGHDLHGPKEACP